MPSVRVLSTNPNVSATALVQALVSGTDLDEAEASFLVRNIIEQAPKAYMEGPPVHEKLLSQIAAILEAHDYVVSIDLDA